MEVIRASVFGIGVIACVQGLLGGLMFWILGIPSALLWGVLMTAVSTIPMLGAFLVWIPAAGFLALVVVSLGSAWGVMEATGSASRRSFLAIYVAESSPALLLVILTTSYVPLILGLMVSFTIVIIPSLYFLGRLVSDPGTMRGREHGRWARRAFWAASAIVVGGGILGLLPFV